ncbi:MAG: Gfo/Idh/MocA family oxidoreductase [Bacteroidales bacterium]|nr:Gfo/Idh/MocA family oxidoreductase [Bacteroidales bacterium]
MADKNNQNKKDSKETNTQNASPKTKNHISRRDVLKSLATVPVLGALAYGVYRKQQYKKFLSKNIFQETNMSKGTEAPVYFGNAKGEKIRVGIIGYGIRGPQLMRGLGFPHPETIDAWKQAAMENPQDKRYQNYMNQPDLNVTVNGVCDIFDAHAERAMEAAANRGREGTNGSFAKQPKRYHRYTDLLDAEDIDAVIVATPDHWHAKIAIDAVKRGKHVYLEKAMTRTVDEAFQVRDAVKKSNVVFQLGHQGRQTESYIKAEEAIKKNVLGKITLVEMTTNRNSPNGAWVYPIHPDASPRTIDWEQFIEPTRNHPFSKERFFRWRCWWDYGTGLSGDLLTHEYDAVNQLMEVGIPRSAMAAGGIFYYRGGRTVADVYQVAYDYPDRDFTLLYSATLASRKDRGKTIMGHDAYMELGNTMQIYADANSTKYEEKINKGIINPDLPIYSYVPGKEEVDAVTSATEQYFAGRGLLYTYRGGRRVDTTHLHIAEWLHGIRTGKQPSCNIDRGFEEAITAHMSTISYRENRKVYWDEENEKII